MCTVNDLLGASADGHSVIVDLLIAMGVCRNACHHLIAGRFSRWSQCDAVAEEGKEKRNGLIEVIADADWTPWMLVDILIAMGVCRSERHR